MKKILWFTLTLFLATSCMKDKGNYAYKEINEITIDSIINIGTGKAQEVHIISKGDSLRLRAVMKQSMVENLDNLNCSWIVITNDKWDTIAKTPELRIIPKLDIGSYKLNFYAEDIRTGIFTNSSVDIKIDGMETTGYMVLGNLDGTCDLNLINTTDKVINHVIEKNNAGQSIPYAPLEIRYAVAQNNAAIRDLYLFYNGNGNDKGVVLSSMDYRIKGGLETAFHVAPEQFVPQAYWIETNGTRVRWDYFINNGRLHPRETLTGYLAAGKYAFYPDFPGDYYLSPWAIVNTNCSLFYDQKNRRFLRAKMTTQPHFDKTLYAGGYDAANEDAIKAFDPDNVGLDMLYMQHGANHLGYALTKDPQAAKYYILKFNTLSLMFVYKWVSQFKHEVPQSIVDAGIGQSPNYAISRCDPYMYWIKENVVYRYDLEYDINVPILNCDTIVPGDKFDMIYLRNNGGSIKEAENTTLHVAHSPKNGDSGRCGSLTRFRVDRAGMVAKVDTTWRKITGKIVSIDYKWR